MQRFAAGAVELNTLLRLNVEESKQSLTGKAAMMHLWMIFSESLNIFGASTAATLDSRLYTREELALILRWRGLRQLISHSVRTLLH